MYVRRRRQKRAHVREEEEEEGGGSVIKIALVKIGIVDGTRRATCGTWQIPVAAYLVTK